MTDRLRDCSGNGVSNIDWQPLEGMLGVNCCESFMFMGCVGEFACAKHLDTPIPQSRPRWDMLSPYKERVRPNLPPRGNQSRFQLRGFHAGRTRA